MAWNDAADPDDPLGTGARSRTLRTAPAGRTPAQTAQAGAPASLLQIVVPLDKAASAVACRSVAELRGPEPPLLAERARHTGKLGPFQRVWAPRAEAGAPVMMLESGIGDRLGLAPFVQRRGLIATLPGTVVRTVAEPVGKRLVLTGRTRLRRHLSE